MPYQKYRLLLQVPGEQDQHYVCQTDEAYHHKLHEISQAMKATGKEYYVFLIRKSKGNKIGRAGIAKILAEKTAFKMKKAG